MFAKKEKGKIVELKELYIETLNVDTPGDKLKYEMEVKKWRGDS